MRLENPEWWVCALKYSKRLKELGVEQKSLWWWTFNNIYDKGKPEYLLRNFRDDIMVCYSAFTVAELGEMLPQGIHTIKNKQDDEWMCVWGADDGSGKSRLEYANTEANARAKMLIYLLENKLI